MPLTAESWSPLLALLWGALIAFALAWVLVAWWIRFSLRARIVDVPGERSSHTRATPRGGGVGIVAAVLPVVALATATGHAADATGATWAAGLLVFVAALSFADDVRSLPSVLRLACHAGAAAAAALQLDAFKVVTLPFLSPIVLPAWGSVLLTAVWIVGLTNVYNFMDGIDGIAGVQGMVAALAWAAFGWWSGASLAMWSGLVLAAACAGFLVHNWAPARVFMGDVGSAFLGFAFAILPLLALRSGRIGDSIVLAGAVPIFAGFVVGPFIGDGVFTLLRRIKHGQNLLRPHRTHLYQRLIIVGWSHAMVARFYLVWAVFGTLCGGMYLFSGDWGRTAALTCLLVSVLVMFALVKREERRVMRAGEPNDD